MGEHVECLLSLATKGRDLPVSPGELLELQLSAASERLAEQRDAIPVLDRRARDAAIDAIRSTEDLVPLLFAHSVYKSYPESFLLDGRWDRMSKWLDTVAAHPAAQIDVADIADADDWISRLGESGIKPVVSSGTSGKHSFLPLDEADVEFLARRADTGLSSRPVTFLGPSNAPMRIAITFKALAGACGRPGAVHSLESPMRVADQIRFATIRKKMANETAVPSEVAALHSEAGSAAAAREKELAELLATVLSYRSQPQLIIGGWPMLWRLMEAAREAGIGPGAFDPETVITLGGGLKGATLPDGYDEHLRRFFQPAAIHVTYGMSELSGGFPACEHGAYHTPPWIIPMIVDESGEKLLNRVPDGAVRGRFAAYDPAWQGIWGGVVSGDQLTLDYGPCPCGLPGPTIGADIVRYSELSGAGDDKLTCGGTIEAYIRGVVAK